MRNIDNSHFLCCADDQMWQGFYVMTQTVTPFNTGCIHIYQYSLIEDADTGVNVISPNTPHPGAYNSSFVYSESVEFNRCHVGINMNNYTASISGAYPLSVNQTSFTSRVFSTYTVTGSAYPMVWPDIELFTSPFIPANPVYPPYEIDDPATPPGAPYTHTTCKDTKPANVGILLYGVGQVTTTAPATYYGPTFFENLYDNLQYGIFATKSNVTSSRSTFMYMQAIGTGHAAYAGDGIYAYQYVPPTGGITSASDYYQLTAGTTPSTRNLFYECRDGIECTGYTKITIEQDKMWSDHTSTLTANAWVDGNTGINLASDKYTDIIVNNNYVSNYMNGITYETANQQHNGTLTISADTILGQTDALYWPLGFCNVGITAMNTLPGSGFYTGVVTIGKNEIVNVYNGIIVNGYSNEAVLTDGNDISLIQSPATATQYGIQNTNCGKNQILDNYITGDPTATTILPNATGIYGGDNTTFNATVQCNSENYVNIGFDFEGPANPTNWNHNVMEQNNIGMQFNGLIGSYSSATSPSDNYWVPGGWSAINPQTFAFTSSASSTLWVRHGTPTPYDPFFNGGVVTYAYSHGGPTFSLKYSTTTSGYTSCVPPAPGFSYSTFRTMGDSSGFDSSGIDTTIGMSWSSIQPGFEGIVTLTIDSLADSAMTPTDIAQRNWVAQKRVYDDMGQESSLADSSALLSEFYSMAGNSRYAWLAKIDSFLEQGDTTDAQALLAYGEDYFAVNIADTTTHVAVADNTNADVVVNNYVNIYIAYLDYLKGDVNSYDSVYISTIAGQCPMEYGAIVYTARSLYWNMYRDMSIFSDICPAGYIGWRNMQPKSIDLDTTQIYTLYPNPNNGSFTLQQKIPNNNLIELNITNIVGQTIVVQFIIFTNGQYKVKLPLGTPSGMYLLKLKNANNTYNFKFVVE